MSLSDERLAEIEKHRACAARAADRWLRSRLRSEQCARILACNDVPELLDELERLRAREQQLAEALREAYDAIDQFACDSGATLRVDRVALASEPE